MILEFIRKNDLITNNWSGGTTTQLAIFPKESIYQERNFIFRLSSATVETEESTFTLLPGVTRVIMILQGEITLDHEGKYVKKLRKFETDKFQGDWQTKGFGKVTDFNLMTTGKAHGELEGLHLTKEEIKSFEFDNFDVFGFYVLNGTLAIETIQERVVLNTGDLILIHGENRKEKFSMKTTENCEVVISKINLGI